MTDDREMITHRLTIVVDFKTYYDEEHAKTVQPGRPAHTLLSNDQGDRMLEGNLEIVNAFWGDAEPEPVRVQRVSQHAAWCRILDIGGPCDCSGGR